MTSCVSFLGLALLLSAPGVALGADASRGRTVFDTQCAVCHGLSGDGQGPEAHRFATRPTDLRRGTFKFRSTPTGSLPRDQDLERTIRRGLPGSGMVAQDHLTDTDVRDVIVYVKTLSPRWSSQRVAAPIVIVRPANLESLVAQGPALFQDAG
ncbi:MAG: c-type cytochrome, partial [Candidatus Rokuibacteriota bacterium]